MNQGPCLPAIVETYLRALRKGLGNLPSEEREEILSDLRSLIQEHADQASGDDAELQELLARLGPPEVLARTYRMERLLALAAKSSAPFAIANASLQWAITGVGGMLASFVLALGYLTALGFLFLGVMKTIFPANVGLWIPPGPYVFGSETFGALWPVPPGQEILGWAFTPLCLAIALMLFVLTTRFTRWLLGLAQKHFAPPTSTLK